MINPYGKMQLIEIARTRPIGIAAEGVDDVQPDPVETNMLPKVQVDVNPVPPLSAGSE